MPNNPNDKQGTVQEAREARAQKKTTSKEASPPPTKSKAQGQTSGSAKAQQPQTTGRRPDFDLYTIRNKDGGDKWKKHCAIWVNQNGYLTGQFDGVRVVLKPRSYQSPPQTKDGQSQPPPKSAVQEKPEILH